MAWTGITRPSALLGRGSPEAVIVPAAHDSALRGYEYPLRTEAIGALVQNFPGRGKISCDAISRLVVAVRAADPVVGVSQVVLGDLDRSCIRGEDQVLVEDYGPEVPARRQLQVAG